MTNPNGIGSIPTAHSAPSDGRPVPAQLAWSSFMRYCRELGHGEIEKLKIQDGVPVMAEFTTRKVRFGP
jgi:ribosomal protein S12 methylthiotransferase accessory factor YcaO